MDDVWAPPGPGSWLRDDVHFSGAISGYLATLFPPAFREGWRLGFARYGLPIDTLEPSIVGGRMFARVHPVGAPEPKPGTASSPPPKIVMRALFALHPELRRRRKTAIATLNTKRWSQDRANWRTLHGPSLRARCLELQADDPTALDDAALRDHIAKLERVFHEGNVIHFSQMPASAIPVGDFVAHVGDWMQGDLVDIIAALQGYAPTSAQPMAALDAIALAAQRTPGLSAMLADSAAAPEARLAELRASSSDAAAALDSYLEEYGNRIITGFDVTDRTLDELPAVVVASVSARMSPAPTPDPARSGDEAAARLRERVPSQHRARFDELLGDARDGYALHDEDVGYAFTWPLGLLRRALLVAGERLVARGVIEEQAHIFEAEPTEVAALLSDAPSAPSGSDLSRRAQDRARLSQLDPPDILGPEGALPDPSIFPRPVARITAALLAYIADANLVRAAPAGSERGVVGVGASPGVYEGRARVLRGPEQMDRVEVGDVLIAPITSPAYNTVLPLLGAIVTDKGGALCHAAIVAREFGIPAVVGTVTATTRITDGAKVQVDGTSGTVTVVG